MWADMETTAQINSELGLGTTLFLERLFEAPRSRDIGQLLGYYRFNRHHRLDFGYMRMKNEGTATLIDEEIDVGDFTFEVNPIGGARSKVFGFGADWRFAEKWRFIVRDRRYVEVVGDGSLTANTFHLDSLAGNSASERQMYPEP